MDTSIRSDRVRLDPVTGQHAGLLKLLRRRVIKRSEFRTDFLEFRVSRGPYNGCPGVRVHHEQTRGIVTTFQV